MRLHSAVTIAFLILLNHPIQAQTGVNLGFDRNEYPGDVNLRILHRTFSFSGYWLNNPPGASSNTWAGKRARLKAAGFGFLVLFNGRLYQELKNNPAALGRSDGRAAAVAARREGFAPGTVIFLDIEEGGYMLPEQKAYIYAWVDAAIAAGFRAGVYCSGIPVKAGQTNVVTAEDIRQNAGRRKIAFFVTDDACPPSPGCAFSKRSPSQSGINFAEVWQFAQSPKRRNFAAQCPANYNPDGNCYPPGMDPALKLHLDVETATKPDPSRGR